MTKPEEPDSPYSIRRATRDDIDAIAVIEALSFFSIDEIFTPQQIARLIRNSNAITLVVERNAEVVGWATALRRRTLRGITGRLYSIALHPKTRGQGLGEALARAIIHHLHADRCTRIYLEVRTTNDPAIHLYQRLGFAIVRTMPDYYNIDIHAYSMRLDLADAPQPRPDPTPRSVPVLFSAR